MCITFRASHQSKVSRRNVGREGRSLMNEEMQWNGSPSSLHISWHPYSFSSLWLISQYISVRYKGQTMAATILSSAGLRLFFDKFCLLIQLSDRFLLSAVSMLIMSTNLWPVFQDHKSHGVAEIHLNAAPPFIHFDSTKARQIETCKVSKNMKNSSVDKGGSTLHSLDTHNVQVNF